MPRKTALQNVNPLATEHLVRVADITLSRAARTRAENAGRQEQEWAMRAYDVTYLMAIKNCTADAHTLLSIIGAQQAIANDPSRGFFQKRSAASEVSRALKQLDELLNDKPCMVDLEARRKIDGQASDFNLLHRAAMLGLTDIVKRLLDMGANVNALSDNGSALKLAIQYNQGASFDLLLSRGALPDHVTPTEEERSHFKINKRSAPITQAASSNNGKIIRRLLDGGADPNFLDASEREYVLEATRWGSQIDAARALLEYGANPNLGRIMPPLAEGTFSSTPEYLSLLLDYGANMHLPSPESGAYHQGVVQAGRREQDQARANVIKTRYDEANARWSAIEKEFNPTQISASDIVWCANIGKLDALMDLPGWGAANAHLQHVLSETPPWITDHIQTRRPDLVNTPPESTGWCARITAHVIEKQRNEAGQGR